MLSSSELGKCLWIGLFKLDAWIDKRVDREKETEIEMDMDIEIERERGRHIYIIHII
jgi:hypothetical protein